jgi:hypothetical protein
MSDGCEDKEDSASFQSHLSVAILETKNSTEQSRPMEVLGYSITPFFNGMSPKRIMSVQVNKREVLEDYFLSASPRGPRLILLLLPLHYERLTGK